MAVPNIRNEILKGLPVRKLNRLSILRDSMDIPSTERDKQSAHDGPRSYGVHEARVPRP